MLLDLYVRYPWEFGVILRIFGFFWSPKAIDYKGSEIVAISKAGYYWFEQDYPKWLLRRGAWLEMRGWPHIWVSCFAPRKLFLFVLRACVIAFLIIVFVVLPARL